MKYLILALVMVSSYAHATNDRLCSSQSRNQWSVDPDACVSTYEQYRVGYASTVINLLYPWGSCDEINHQWSMDLDGQHIEAIEDIFLDCND